MSFKVFLQLLYDELSKLKDVSKHDLFARLETVSNNYESALKLLEVGKKIGRCNDTPYKLKYWF